MFEVRAGFRTGISMKPILPARTPNPASMEFKSLTRLQTATRQVGSWTSCVKRANYEKHKRKSIILNENVITQTKNIFVAKLGIHPGAGIPVAPGNLSISINGSNVLLDWGDVAFDLAGNPVNVNHYLVYYCATGPAAPFTVFGEDGSITQSQWTHSDAASLSPGFYYVTAVIAN